MPTGLWQTLSEAEGEPETPTHGCTEGVPEASHFVAPRDRLAVVFDETALRIISNPYNRNSISFCAVFAGCVTWRGLTQPDDRVV
jgi:hypothetical protein